MYEIKAECHNQMAANRVKSFGNHIYHYTEIDSTNIQAKRLITQGIEHGNVVTTDYQTAGKGRLGRTWISAKYDSFCMSIYLQPNIVPMNVSMLTLVAALAVCNTIYKLTNIETHIKWPNDIILHSKKVSGILTEMNADENHLHHVIVGIGINVNVQYIDQGLVDIATSLYLETGMQYKNEDILQHLLLELENCYEEFMKTHDMSNLMSEYNHKLINIDKQVKIINKNNNMMGIAKGINSKGELQVEVNGMIENVSTGEVSVRGICGYV